MATSITERISAEQAIDEDYDGRRIKLRGVRDGDSPWLYWICTPAGCDIGAFDDLELAMAIAADYFAFPPVLTLEQALTHVATCLACSDRLGELGDGSLRAMRRAADGHIRFEGEA